MRWLTLWTLASLAVHCAAARGEDGGDFFERNVRPVLVAKCYECHGSDEPEAGLRLDSRANLLKGGKSGAAVVAGKPDESLLIRAVSQRGKLKMPPDGKLRDDEIAALAKWVALGVPWTAAADARSPAAPAKSRGEMIVTDADRQHWSFRPIANPPAPAVRDARWAQSSVDPFILSKLESAGLAPAPPADRRSLIRRAYYDLIGLPPTWDEVQAFEKDAAPDAFARVVDHLLASPRYGERWGRHWLDVARYADTKDGVLMFGDDRVRPYSYTYRDYVIRALNEDLPFDRFIEEQLAADQIQPAVEPWRLAALGFLTLGRMYDNNIHDVIDDQIDTVSRGFLGLTVACARCHDHKYDPIPTADYYSLYGVFASSEVPLELPTIETPAAEGEAFEKQLEPKRAELRKFLDDQYALLSEAARQRTGDYLVRVATTRPDPLETAIFFLSLAPDDLRPPITARWRKLIARRARSDDPEFGPWHALMQLPDAADRGESADDAPPAPDFTAKAAAVLDRWSTRADGIGPGQMNPLVREALAKATLASRADVARAYGELLNRVYAESKPSVSATASPPIIGDARRRLLDLVVGRESPCAFTKSQTRQYMSREPKDAFGAKIQEIDRMVAKSPQAVARAIVMVDAQAACDPCIFVRGNASERGRPVPRQFLAVLSPAGRTPFPHGSGRWDLARAIAAPDNPLTSRVIVNRVWMHHLGEPLVSTPSDFGHRSTPPTHPELLDHLATRFMAEGWSLKKLHRWIMLSSTYQQSSSPTGQDAEHARSADPENRWLWRMPRRRLDFEAMRDTLLAVSGRLQQRSTGRSVEVASDPLCRCRTVYGVVDRQNLPGLFRAFDFATPDQSVERRSRTMVPQQALFALNSPFVAEQAKALAARPEIVAADQPAERIAALFHAVLIRQPTPAEVEECLDFVAHAADGQSKLTNWEQLAQVLLASNESMYLD